MFRVWGLGESQFVHFTLAVEIGCTAAGLLHDELGSFPSPGPLRVLVRGLGLRVSLGFRGEGAVFVHFAANTKL